MEKSQNVMLAWLCSKMIISSASNETSNTERSFSQTFDTDCEGQ